MNTCSSDIDSANLCMSVRAAHECDCERARQLDIVQIATFAQEKTRIFNPQDLGTNHFPSSRLTSCHIQSFGSGSNYAMTADSAWHQYLMPAQKLAIYFLFAIFALSSEACTASDAAANMALTILAYPVHRQR